MMDRMPSGGSSSIDCPDISVDKIISRGDSKELKESSETFEYTGSSILHEVLQSIQAIRASQLRVETHLNDVMPQRHPKRNSAASVHVDHNGYNSVASIHVDPPPGVAHHSGHSGVDIHHHPERLNFNYFEIDESTEVAAELTANTVSSSDARGAAEFELAPSTDCWLTSLQSKFEDDQGAKYLKPARSMYESEAEGNSPRYSEFSRKSTMRRSRSMHHHPKNLVQRIVFHPMFEVACACVILVHAFVIGLLVDLKARGDYGPIDALNVLNQLLVLVFMTEVTLKILAERLVFFVGKEQKWNWFDLFLIFMVLIDFLFRLVMTSDDTENVAREMLKVGEILRTFRILRIFRVLRFSTSLRMILSKIFNSVRTLFWVIVLIFLCIFVVSVCITNGCTQYLEDHDVPLGDGQLNDTESAAVRFFGSIPKTLLSVFQSVTGGILWSEIYVALMDMSVFYVALMLAFIAFTIFAGLNIITGIFVDCALQTGVQERDLIMERHAQLEEVSVEHLREVFFDMDGEENGFITLNKFRDCLKDDRVRTYMLALKIDTKDAQQLFRLLDVENSGEILIDEFVEGCMKLRGDARSMDVHILICENRRMWTKLGIFCEQLIDMITKMNKSTDRVGVEEHLKIPPTFLQPLSAHSSRRTSRSSNYGKRDSKQSSMPFDQRSSGRMAPGLDMCNAHHVIQETAHRLSNAGADHDGRRFFNKPEMATVVSSGASGASGATSPCSDVACTVFPLGDFATVGPTSVLPGTAS